MAEFALKVAAVVFIFVALIHAARLILKVKIKVGNFDIPVWLSIVGITVALLLAWLMLRSV